MAYEQLKILTLYETEAFSVILSKGKIAKAAWVERPDCELICVFWAGN